MDSFDDLNILDYLRELHPGTFEGWDEFETAFEIRNRKGEEPIVLVVLYNKGEDGHIVSLHASFLLTTDENEQDVVRVGRTELVQEYRDAYIPANS